MARGIKVEVPDVQAWVRANKDAFLREANECGSLGLSEAADLLGQTVLENISRTDFSLEDLRDMGHPFARRRVGGGTGPASAVSTPLPKPYQVHTQGVTRRGRGGGPLRLIDAFRIESDDRGQGRVDFDVGVDEAMAAHVRHIIFGTRTMVSRDFLNGSLFEVLDEMFDIFEDVTRFKRIRVRR